MKIIEKLNAKKDMMNNPPVTIAFLGDSVTQGCFECYIDDNGGIETVFDYPSAFSSRLREILNILYPSTQVNIINSGISGGAAPGGLWRLERDVINYHPDLVVVSFGLNDCCNDKIPLPLYLEKIRNIVTRLREEDIEVIFLTQNMMNTKLSGHLTEPKIRESAKLNMQRQLDGVLAQYMTEGAAVAKECGAEICDLHSVWLQLAESGVDTTELLANKINHPIRQFHYYMAIKLIEKMFDIN